MHCNMAAWKTTSTTRNMPTPRERNCNNENIICKCAWSNTGAAIISKQRPIAIAKLSQHSTSTTRKFKPYSRRSNTAWKRAPPQKNKIDSVLDDTSNAAKKNRPEPTLGTIGMFTKSSPNPEIDVTLAAAEPETTLSPSFWDNRIANQFEILDNTQRRSCAGPYWHYIGWR